MNLKKIVTVIFVFILIFISGCSSDPQGTAPQISSARTETVGLIAPSYTPIPQLTSLAEPTISPTRTPTTIVTSTPTPTAIVVTTLSLTPDPKLAQGIEYLMKYPVRCDTACLWGIAPEKSSLNEARSILKQLGMDFIPTTPNHYASGFLLPNGLNGTAIMKVINSTIVGIRFTLSGFDRFSQVGDWHAYSADRIFSAYGTPTWIGMVISTPHEVGARGFFVDYQLYYENIHMLVMYSGGGVEKKNNEYTFCPNQKFIDVWYGSQADNIPDPGDRFEQVTSLRVDEFTKSLIKDPHACIYFKADPRFEH